MNVVRKFATNQSGSASVEWIVLVAAVIGMTTAVSVVVFSGANESMQDVSEGISSIADARDAVTETPEAPQAKWLTVDTTPIDTSLSPYFQMLEVATQITPVRCDGTYEDTTGLTAIVCQANSDVVSVPRPELFFYKTPEALISQSCVNPSYMLHNLIGTPQISCEDFKVVLASVTPALRPESPNVDKAARFDSTDPCLIAPDQEGNSAQGCQLSNGIIAPAQAEMQPMFASFSTSPEFTKPAECRRVTCQFTRKSEAKPAHSYQNVAPAFNAPARCANPPCVFSRPADTPQAPSMPTLDTPSDREAPSFQYYEEAEPEDTDTLLLSSSELRTDVAYVVSTTAETVPPNSKCKNASCNGL